MKINKLYSFAFGFAALFICLIILFASRPMKSSDPSITRLVDATMSFQNSLSEDLKKKACKPITDKELFEWNATPPSINSRGGEKIGKLDSTQKALLYNVIDAFLSDDGFKKVEYITKDAETFLENINATIWGSRNYHFVLFGNAETDPTWGLQFDGHHCAINFIVSGDKVTITPAFMGSEPVTLNGYHVFEQEELLGYQFMSSLSPELRDKAIIKQGDPKGEIVTVPRMFFDKDKDRHFDYSKFENQGVLASDLNPLQKAELKQLILVYVNNMDARYNQEWILDIEKDFENTLFSWIGPVEKGERIYYRIYNDAILIEFDHPGGMALKEEKDKTNHIHTITRAPNGKDYSGIGLINGPESIQEHYHDAEHHQH